MDNLSGRSGPANSAVCIKSHVMGNLAEERPQMDRLSGFEGPRETTLSAATPPVPRLDPFSRRDT
jgi:hypothetical protein